MYAELISETVSNFIFIFYNVGMFLLPFLFYEPSML